MAERLALLLIVALALPTAAKGPKNEPSSLPLFPPTTEDITVPLVAERFERLDRDMLGLRASFRQSVRSEDAGRTQAAEGTFAYRKKNLLLIEHRLPERQTLVCDGTEVWVWRPADGQVIRSKFEDWKRSQPLAQGLLDFGNYADIIKRYAVSVGTVSAPGLDGHRSFELVLRPRPNAALSGKGERPPSKDGVPLHAALSGKGERPPSNSGKDDFTLILRLSTRDFFPFESELRMGAVSARMAFADVRFNPELPETLFRFSPPPGADILDFPAPAR